MPNVEVKMRMVRPARRPESDDERDADINEMLQKLDVVLTLG